MPELFWNDQWTTEIRHLGFTPVGDQLTQMIIRSPLPFAIGVNGKWGSGKTSLMRYAMASLGGTLLEATLPGQIEKEMELKEISAWADYFKPYAVVNKILRVAGCKDIDRDQVIKSVMEHAGYPLRCVWFNPWQYQQDPNPLIPLLHEIRTQVDSQVESWLSQKDKESLVKSIKVSVEAGLALIGKLPTLAGMPELSVSSIREIGERLERENLEIMTDAQRFNLLFEKAVSLMLGKGQSKGLKGKYKNEIEAIEKSRRLIIFIDDLDRCEDAQIRHLLEAIKLYLSTDNCMFVLGLDRSAAERAICREREDKSEREAAEYVEKLFQATVNVPVCQDYRPFIAEKLKLAGFSDEDLHGRFSSGQARPVDFDKKTFQTKTSKNAGNAFTLLDVLIRLLEPNPRKIKNFLNGFVIQWKIQEENINRYLSGFEDHRGTDFEELKQGDLKAKSIPRNGEIVSQERKILLIEFAMIHYLRLYHPSVFRLLEQDQDLFENFLSVIASGKSDLKAPEDEMFFEEFEHALHSAFPAEDSDARAHRRALLRERRDILRGDRAFCEMLTPVFNELKTMDDPSVIHGILFGRTVPE